MKCARFAIAFSVLALVVGIGLPRLLSNLLINVGITLPTLRGSSKPALELSMSGATVLLMLRVTGIILALCAAIAFAWVWHNSHHHPSPREGRK